MSQFMPSTILPGSSEKYRRLSELTAFLFALVFAGLCLPDVTAAQEPAAERSIVPAGVVSGTPETDTRWHFQFDLFQMLMVQQGVLPAESLDSVLRRPEKSVVVMIGDLTEISRDSWLSMLRFAAQGGAVMLASDQNCQMNGIGQFHAGPVTATRAADRYQGYADCVRITSLQKDEPLRAGVEELICNRAGWFTPQADGSLIWRTIASQPATSRPASSRSKPIAAIGKVSDEDVGSIVVVSDQSLFSNSMLWHGDNAAFAIRITEHLVSGGRDRMVFLTDGSVSGIPLPANPQKAQIPPVVPPLPQQLPEPELETMLRVANKVIRRVEESDILNKALRNQPRNVRLPAYQYVVMLMLATMAAAWIIYRMFRRGRLQTAAVSIRRMLPASTMVLRQHASRLEFGTAAEILARDFCREVTGSSVPDDWERILKDREAPIRRRLSRSQVKLLGEVLELAVRGGRIHISRRHFENIGRTILQIRQLSAETATS